MDLLNEIKVPKARIAVLIGAKGETKRKIEEELHVTLTIDSKEGDVVIAGEDALDLLVAQNIVKAVGRGFNPDLALNLLKPDYNLEIIQLNDYGAKSPESYIRLKGRVIGKEGKSRISMESLTETNISVYGKTIAVIGRIENVNIARRAIDSLLTGSPHSSVYRWLEKKRKELIQKDRSLI